ncbi:MAG: hypothetical protein N2C14_26875, partial [Planctomycetales bacterium]
RPATIISLAQLKVTVTTVAVGSHGAINQQTMRKIARQTGGKYYMVKNAKTLPKIFQKEARRVARPLIYENTANPFAPEIVTPSEMIQGIDSMPPITGYVMTEVKDSPLVEVSLVSPLPQGNARQQNRTLLAHWQYGLGKTVVWTTDGGNRWAKGWTEWENYSKLFSQIVRFSMRPTGDTGKFSIVKEIKDGKVKIIINALDQDNDFLNDLTMRTSVIAPDGDSMEVVVAQTAPGRYEGVFEADQAGSYIIAASPGVGKAPLRTGVNVPYSAEFRERETNVSLLENLAALSAHGKQGRMIQAPKDADDVLEGLLRINPFRHDMPEATSSQDAWHWLVMAAAALFFFDVLNRRVAIGVGWLVPILSAAWSRLRGRDPQPVESEYMDRLRGKKAELTQRIEKQRASARFEVDLERQDYDHAVEEASAPEPPSPSRPAASSDGVAAGEPEEESYTDRLLRAKKKVWDDRKDDQP